MAKKNTGLRLDDATLARVNVFLAQLRTEPGRSDATPADAIRVLLDLGLGVAGVSAPMRKAKR